MTPVEKLRRLLESKGIYKEAITLMKAHKTLKESEDKVVSAQMRHQLTRKKTPKLKESILNADFNTFMNAYIEAILFTFSDEEYEVEAGEATVEDISEEGMRKIKQDCINFCKQAGASNLAQYGWEHAGHDFWLTREGHGVGFWENDHATPEICEKLDKIAKSFGEGYAHMGDDREIYL